MTDRSSCGERMSQDAMGPTLAEVLSSLLSADNVIREQAESYFAHLKATSSRSLLLGLMEVVHSGQDSIQSQWIRSLSMVLLRGISMRESSLWTSSFNATELNEIRSELMNILGSETIKHIQRKLIHTIAAMSCLCEWPDLMPMILNYAQSEEISTRYLIMLLLEKLLEYTGRSFMQHIQIFAPVIVSNMAAYTSMAANIDGKESIALLSTEDKTIYKAYLLSAGAAALALLSFLYEVNSLTDSSANSEANECIQTLQQHLSSVLQITTYLLQFYVSANSNNNNNNNNNNVAESEIDVTEVQHVLLQIFESYLRLATDRPHLFTAQTTSGGNEGDGIVGQHVLQLLLPITHGTDLPQVYDNDDNEKEDVDMDIILRIRSLSLQIAVELLTSHTSAPVLTINNQELRIAYLQCCMSLVAEIDPSDEATMTFLQTEERSLGNGGNSDDIFNMNEENTEDILAPIATVSLKTLADCQYFNNAELVNVVVEQGFTQIQHSDWRVRRAALVVAGVICEGCTKEMYRYIEAMVPPLLEICVQDTHPRVKYAALRCLSDFAIEFAGDDDDDDVDDDDSDDSDEDEEKVGGSDRDRKGNLSFQQLFSDAVPPVLYQVLSNHASDLSVYSRIVYMCLYTFRVFCDPDRMVMAHGGGGGVEMDGEISMAVLDYCYALLAHSRDTGATASLYPIHNDNGDNTTALDVSMSTVPIDVSLHTPLFILHECVSLMANLANVAPSAVMASRYIPFMTLLTSSLHTLQPTIQQSKSVASGDNGTTSSHNAVVYESLTMAILRCRTLEGIALVGKCQGSSVFRESGYAANILEVLVQCIHEGLEYSDQLTSMIYQCCVRISALCEEDFLPYIPIVIPALIQYISTDIAVDVYAAEEGDDDDNNHRSSNDSDDNTFTIYRRGHGLVHISYNSFQLQEQIMAIRILYQYCIDIPQHLSPYVPAAILSLSKLLESIVVDSELAFVAGSCLGDLLLIYAKYIDPDSSDNGDNNDNDGSVTAVSTFNGMVDHVLSALFRATCDRITALTTSGNDDNNDNNAGGDLSGMSLSSARHVVNDKLMATLLDTIRETVYTIYKARFVLCNVWPTELGLSENQSRVYTTLLTNLLLQWISVHLHSSSNSNSINNDGGVSVDQGGPEIDEVSASIRDGALDSLGWILKCNFHSHELCLPSSCNDSTYPAFFTSEVCEPMMAMLTTLSSSQSSTSAIAHVIQIPMLILIDSVQYLGPISDFETLSGTSMNMHGTNMSMALMPHLLQHYSDTSLVVHAIGGMGRCLVHLIESFNTHSSHGNGHHTDGSEYHLSQVLTLVLAILGVDVGSNDNHTNVTILQGLSQLEVDDEEEAILKDTALSTLVIICVYGHMLVGKELSLALLNTVVRPHYTKWNDLLEGSYINGIILRWLYTASNDQNNNGHNTTLQIDADICVVVYQILVQVTMKVAKALKKKSRTAQGSSTVPLDMDDFWSGQPLGMGQYQAAKGLLLHIASGESALDASVVQQCVGQCEKELRYLQDAP